MTTCLKKMYSRQGRGTANHYYEFMKAKAADKEAK